MVSRWVHVSCDEGAGHGRADTLGLPEDRGIGIPGPCHARRAAHRHRHHRKPWRSRARHAGRDAGRAGADPRQQALQTGQPRRKSGKYGHHFSGHGRHLWRSRDCRHCRALRHRKPRTSHGGGRAGMPRRSAIFSRRRLQAAHFALFVSGTGRSRACRSWPKFATNSG